MKRKVLSLVFVFAILLSLIGQIPMAQAAGHFTPHPQNAYAQAFADKCDGQQWFIDEVERQLNLEEKTIDRANSPEYFASIISLGFADKGIEGRIPRAIGELTSLKHLFLSENKLSGEIFPELCNLAKLENLDLSCNMLTGNIPGGLADLAQLRTLLLWGNRLTGGIPDALGEMQSLRNLDISQNPIAGGIPVTLGALPRLEYLGISKSGLTGAIPKELGNIATLKGLSLWGNNLTGGIPAELGNLTCLEILDVSQNPNLGGEIPSELGSCVSLLRLGASGCKLTGEIPASLSDLANLQTLDLSHNILRGEIPAAFGNPMPALTSLFLHNNMLAGYAPDGLAEKEAGSGNIDLSANYLTGPELLKLVYNANNFCDGADNVQNRLYLAATIQINKDAIGNLYASLRNFNIKTGSQNSKPLLWTTEYVIRVVTGDENNLEFTVDVNGIYVKPLVDIPLASPYVLEIQILHNDDSSYSTARFNLVTEPPRSTSGSSIGGVTVVDEGDVPLALLHTAYIFGYSDGTFRAGNNTTRAEFVTMVCRAAGAEPEESSGNFPDVQETHWAAGNIAAAKSLGWINGYPNGNFGANDFITRAEAAAILCRFTDPEVVNANKFSDIDGHWAQGFIETLASLGNLNGYPDGTYRPNANITRAELVTMINAVFIRNPDEESLNKYKPDMPFSDVIETHWAFWNILEASVDHEAH